MVKRKTTSSTLTTDNLATAIELEAARIAGTSAILAALDEAEPSPAIVVVRETLDRVEGALFDLADKLTNQREGARHGG